MGHAMTTGAEGMAMSEIEYKDVFAERKHQIVLFRFGGVPAKTCAAWLSAVEKAQYRGERCPTWPELEAIAPSLPTKLAATDIDSAIDDVWKGKV